MPRVRPIVFITLLVVLSLASRARADVGGKEFDISIGYAHLSLDGSAAPFDDRGGIRVEPRFSFGAGGETSGLRLGFALGISGFEKSHDEDFLIVDDDGEVHEFDGDSGESLTLLTPEVQLSWRQMFGPAEGENGQRRWFVEPGVAVGVVIGNYWIGDTFGFSVDTDLSEWDATIAGRPFVRVGWAGETWVFGVEGSYLFGGDLDFTDAVGGNVEEWYGGFFVGGHW